MIHVPHRTTRRTFAARSASAFAGALLLHRSAALAQTNSLSLLKNVVSPLDFGAKGDGQTKDTAALQRCIDHCFQTGGACVLDPHRKFLSGGLTLHAGTVFHLAQGSTLVASADRADYFDTGALLFAKDVDGIHISGTGSIDGNFRAFFPPKGPDGYPVPQPFLGPYDPLYGPDMKNPPDGRPRMILLVNCKQVSLQDFTIRDSPTWTIHPVGCEDLHIHGISILNDLDVPNCDGIDIDHCRQVRIESCNIVAGDDCLILKASRNFGQYGPCEGITITNCTLESSSAGIKIETEGPYPLRSAVISNCSIVRSNRGISFLNRDGATVEDMLFTGMTIETKMRPLMWWGSGEPIAMSSAPRSQGKPPGRISNVSFVDMVCRGESGIYLRGTQGAELSSISLRNVDLILEKTTSIAGGFYDMRPGDTFGPSGLDRRDIAGVFGSDLNGLDMNGVRVNWQGTAPPYYGAAVELHRCKGLSMVQVTGRAAHAGRPASIFDDVQNATVLTPPRF